MTNKPQPYAGDDDLQANTTEDERYNCDSPIPWLLGGVCGFILAVIIIACILTVQP